MTADKSTVIGIDTGGTFTDFVYIRNGRINVLKVLSTPGNAGKAVLEGLKIIEDQDKFNYSIIHGSTVATNALLERKGASTALITTKGFGDILEIGRQNRTDIYNLNVDRPEPLIPEELRFELSERINAAGEIRKKINKNELDLLLQKLKEKKIVSIAVCFLHSYLNPENETIVADRARECGFTVSPSAEILPEYREYERMSTTVVNAYVAPIMDHYIDSLQKKLDGIKLRIMKSNGGIITAGTARRESVHTILSGPAGGVVGAFAIAKKAGYPKCITFDMGGTSTDVSLCPGRIVTTSESSIAFSPIRVPVIDIHTVGAGGGSLTNMDKGGALGVGPESAGANPGPVSYGKGERLTVTDANLALGRLDQNYFLGGTMRVYPEKMRAALKKTAANYKMGEIELASGIIRVVNSNMEKALRVISIAKGYNPSNFALVSFGGAGSLHAADLARTLNIRTVIIPGNPGIYSAMGMLFSDYIKDYSQTILVPADPENLKKVAESYIPVESKAVLEMKGEGVQEKDIRLNRTADVRYKGQSFELTIPFSENLLRNFHKAHEQRYGYSDISRAAEIVNIRVKCTGITKHPRLKKQEHLPLGNLDNAKIGNREVFNGSEFVKAEIYDRSRLQPGMSFSGTAVVHEYSTTVYVPPDFTVAVDKHNNLIMTI